MTAARHVHIGKRKFFDLGQRRRTMAKRRDETGHRRLAAFYLDRYASGRIQDVACQSQFVGKVVDERPEPYALHNSAHAYALPDGPDSRRLLHRIGL